MVAFTRPAVSVTTAAVVVLGSGLAAAPLALRNDPVGIRTVQSLDANSIALTGFIADLYNSIEPAVAGLVYSVADVIDAVPLVGPPIANQIEILYNYGEQAVGGTVYWVDDLVTPLLNGNFWPLSGQPGNYISGAINSTADWVGGLIDTGIGFVNAEIDYFTGWIPNIPNLVNDVINAVQNAVNWAIGLISNPLQIVSDVINAVENVINWVIGWLPGPLAAVPAPAAVSALAAAPRAAGAVVAPGPRGAGAAAVTESPDRDLPSGPTVSDEVRPAPHDLDAGAVTPASVTPVTDAAPEPGEPGTDAASSARDSGRSAASATARAESPEGVAKADARSGARKNGAARATGTDR